MSRRSASAILDAALAVDFDPEARYLQLQDRRIAQGADPDALSPEDRALADRPLEPMPVLLPEPVNGLPGEEPVMRDALYPNLPPELLEEEPPLPQADEDLPPVSPAPSADQGSQISNFKQGGGGRSASALLADVADEPAAAAAAPVRSADQALPEPVRPRRSAAVLLADVPEAESSGFWRQALDLPVSALGGVISGLKGMSDVAGANNPVSRELATYQQFYQDALSPEAKADQQQIARIMQEAQDKGVWEQLKAGGRAFAVAPLDTAAQSLGTMAPIVATGVAGRAFGLGAKGVQVAQAAAGSGMQMGTVKDEIYQNTKQFLLQQGKSPEDAERVAMEAQSYGGKNLDQLLLAAGLGALDALSGAERILGGAISKTGKEVTGGVIVNALKAGVTEAAPEALQGGQEPLAKNVALQREGYNVPTMRGVVSQGTMEGLMGFAAGGPVGAAEGFGARADVEKPTMRVGVDAPWQAAREQAVPTVTQVEVVGDDVFGEPTTAAVEVPAPTGDERFAPPAEVAAPAPAVSTEETLFGDVEQRGETIVTPPPATDSALVQNLPVVELPVQELQLSRDVPNFKEGADPDTGVVEGERLKGDFQRLGMAPIIVWERQDGRREIISGRHRWDLAKRTKQETIPSQVLREADGFTTQDALILDAELNIRDGQGSIKDYANYFRNTQIDRGAATQRGLLSRAKGRAGFEIGRSGSNDLYAAFANKAVSADKASAIAAAAPNNDTLQRAALGRAGNMTAEQLGGFVRALSARVTAAPETQTDLFGADDSALVQAEQLSKAANAKARQLQEQITAVRSAARRPEAARKMGVDVRDPEGVRRKITELEAQVRRYQEFYANPDVMAELQGVDTAADQKYGGIDPLIAEEPAPLQRAEGPSREYQLAFNFDAEGQPGTALERGAGQRAAGTEAARPVDRRRSRVKILGLAVQHVGTTRPGALLGERIASPLDVAVLSQVYRDPRFETLRVYYLQGDQVVHETAVTSRHAGTTAFLPGKGAQTVERFADDVRAQMARLGATSFYLVHNHPSGRPDPSPGDVKVTQELSKMFGAAFEGHVVINSGKYGLVVSDPNVRQGLIFNLPQSQPDPILGKTAVPHQVLGNRVSSPGDVAGLAKQVEEDPKAYTVLTTDNQNVVRAVLHVDLEMLVDSPTRFAAMMSRLLRTTASRRIFIAGVPEAEFETAINKSAPSRAIIKAIRQGFVTDVISQSGRSFMEQFALSLSNLQAGRGLEVGRTVQEESAPMDAKPRQFEAKARQNEALAPETRARLGSEYIPISLNAQAEAAKEWINTNGLEAAKLRIAQLSGNDTVPTPVDFAIGIEAAGRLSATGDHAGAAGIVSTMSQRATSLGQTISVLAMMARLTPEGIVLYGQNIVSRYINTLPQEAQDRIKALQAEVDRLRTALAEMKFKEGSEVIRSGKLGDEKIQDRIKRRVKSRVQADLGPAATGPEVTAETKARTQGLNRKVRDVLLSDGKQAEMVKQITQILTSAGNMPAAEAEAVGKSIVAAFTKIVTETRRNYVQGAKQGGGARKAKADALLKMLAEKKDMTDAEFVSEISQLMGLPGMTPAMARELRALGQRYENATDPDVKLVLAATMFERAHEVVPADFWVKVRGFAYLSMLFAPKTWIRNVIGNQVQWIFNVGRDAVVSGIMDPAMSLLTGKRTSAGLKLGARLKGLLAPVDDVRRGYLANKQFNPEANFRQNFMAGVNHLRMLSKLTTQNKFEIADVRDVGARIFSSKLMRAWEGTLSIALGAGDRAFWMSQFRASLAQMQAAAEKNGEWTGQPTPEMIEAAMAEAAYAIYQNPNIISANANKIRGALNRLTTFGKTDQYGLGTGLMAFTQVPGSITLRGLVEWSPLGMIPALYRGMRGILYASSTGRIGAKFDQAAFNKEFTQALLGTGALYAAGYYLYALGIVTASREDDEDLEAMRRASGGGAYRINLTALRRALLSGNWFTRQEGEQGDVIVPYDWAQPVAITFAAGAELAAQVERSGREQLKKNLAEKAGMAAMSLAAGAKSLEELPLLSGLSSFIKTWGYAGPLEATTATVAGMPSQFVPQLVRQMGQINDNLVRETRGGDSVVQREFMRVLASVPGYSTKFPVRFDITGQAIQRYQYGGNSVMNVFFSPAMASEVKRNPVLQEVSRLVDTTGETSMVPRQVKRSAKINGVDVDLTNEQLAAYSYYLGNFTMSHFAWRMAAPVYARLPDEMKVKMLAQDITDIDAAVKSAVLGADPRRLTRNQMFLRQALVNSPLGQSVPPR